MSVISPSQWENIPAELLGSVLIPAEADSPLDATCARNKANTNLPIPRDNTHYTDVFHVVHNDLFNDRRLHSSVVRVVSKDSSTAPQIYLGSEPPVLSGSIEPSAWIGTFADTLEEEAREPDLAKEKYPESFMIVPPISSLVDFTLSLSLGDDSPLFDGPATQIPAVYDAPSSVPQLLEGASPNKKPATAISGTTGKTTSGYATVVSDPIKLTRHTRPRRFWRRFHRRQEDAGTDTYIAYRGFRGYVRRIWKKHPHQRNRAMTSTLRQWAHTRNIVFWEQPSHVESATLGSASASASASPAKDLTTS